MMPLGLLVRQPRVHPDASVRRHSKGDVQPSRDRSPVSVRRRPRGKKVRRPCGLLEGQSDLGALWT